MQLMHDWTLLSVAVDWKIGQVLLETDSPSGPATVRVLGLRELRVPRAHPWGKSVSINTVEGPSRREDEFSYLRIEMQSGDLIEIVASSFEMPARSRA